MKQLFALLLFLWLFSCGEDKAQFDSIIADDLTPVQIDSILTKFKFKYEEPIVLDSAHQVLIPISTELLKRRTKFSSDGYYSNDFPRYWNALFYNRQTGDTRLLTEDKYRIYRINTFSGDNENRIMRKKILYEISDIDYNEDKLLNQKDPEFLFSSDIDGKNLKRISPSNEDLIYFKIIPNSAQILVETLRDINQDSLFNKEDESIWYKAEMENQEWVLEEIIDEIGRDEIEKLYFKQWLKKK